MSRTQKEKHREGSSGIIWSRINGFSADASWANHITVVKCMERAPLTSPSDIMETDEAGLKEVSVLQRCGSEVADAKP